MYEIDDTHKRGGVINIKCGYKTTNLSIWGEGEEGYTNNSITNTH